MEGKQGVCKDGWSWSWSCFIVTLFSSSSSWWQLCSMKLIQPQQGSWIPIARCLWSKACGVAVHIPTVHYNVMFSSVEHIIMHDPEPFGWDSTFCILHKSKESKDQGHFWLGYNKDDRSPTSQWSPFKFWGNVKCKALGSFLALQDHIVDIST